MTDLNVQILMDRDATGGVTHHYAAGVDLKDWVLFQPCFAKYLRAKAPNLQAQSVSLSTTGKEKHFTGGGFNDYDFIHTGEGWKIKHCALRIAWSRGDLHC